MAYDLEPYRKFAPPQSGDVDRWVVNMLLVVMLVVVVVVGLVALGPAIVLPPLAVTGAVLASYFAARSTR